MTKVWHRAVCRLGFTALCCSALGLPVASCKEEAPKRTPPLSASAAPPVASVTKPERPWFEGTWSGSFDAKVFTIETEPGQGPLAAWEKPDAKAFVGRGNLRLNVDPAGLTRGTGDGPFGKLTLSGQVDGDTLRLRFASDAKDAKTRFLGFVIALRQGDRFVGTLQASGGDSQQARTAEVQFTKSEAK